MLGPILFYDLRMRWIVLILFLSPVWARALDFQTETLTARTPVYQAPSLEAPLEFYLPSNAQVQVWPAPYGSQAEFHFIRVRSGRQWKSGFIYRALPESVDRETGSAVGLAGLYTEFDRKSNTFTDDDEVNYTTSTLVSRSFAPSVFYQTSARDFWRVTLSYKSIHYQGTVTTDVLTTPEALDIQEHFLMVDLQRAWSFGRHYYLGVGAEAGKALSTSITKAGVAISVSQNQAPIYAGPQVFLGADLPLFSRFSLVGEARYELVASQSPMISNLEFSAMISYWL